MKIYNMRIPDIKIPHLKIQSYLILCCGMCLVACGGANTVKPKPNAPTATTKQAPAPSASSTKSGGYYLDDGPGDNPPQDIDSIPDAMPKKEPLFDRANKPYIALGNSYKPMTSYQPYKASGVSSWYGKRYHGKKTSSGEVYDMYSMTAAHPTLPLPSYVKVTNPVNGRFVVVRVNDRGPFKNDRIIDLSYAAAYKLRFSAQGSTQVIVEAIDTNNTSSNYVASYTQTDKTSSLPAPTATSPATEDSATTPKSAAPIQTNENSNTQLGGYFVQVGAFKNEVNADLLIKKIQGLDIENNAGINKVYNSGLYRLKLGPYDSKKTAEDTAASIRKQLNSPTIITNQ
jgi:rare lipoprotein A